MIASLIQRIHLNGLTPNPSPKGRGVINLLGCETINYQLSTGELSTCQLINW